MARRVALARAIALDPELIMYDEPFAGLDPISMGVAANLIRTLNDTTGATSLVVSHDVEECFEICDYAYLMSSQGTRGRARPAGGAQRVRGSGGASVHSRRARRARSGSTTRPARWPRTSGSVREPRKRRAAR